MAGDRHQAGRRQNFLDCDAAKVRKIALETEFLQGHTETGVRATKLSDEQVRLAEVAFIKLGDDWLRLLDAVDHWNSHGKHVAVAESPRVDDAVKEYLAWLDGTPTLRDATKRHWKTRIAIFGNSVPNIRVADFTAEHIEQYIATRKVGPSGKDTDRRAVSRFFSWCKERPRRWCAVNPCQGVKIEMGEKTPPAILAFAQCKRLLEQAEKFKDGRLVPYVAVCLFAGLRPFEAQRLEWEQVNLADNEIRLEGWQTKTGTPRVVSIRKPLDAWLKAHKGKDFFPTNWRKDFDELKTAIGFGTPTEDNPNLKPWPDDVLRHTAVSFFFRDTGSYGLTAEQFGNSEAIIKQHYQGRVSTDDAKKFFALMPARR